MKKVNVNERILDQLNHHGYFFQYAIDNILKDMKWNTTLEYPLPSNIFIEKKDIGESTDIFAGKMINNRQISLIVECKKVNTNECQWIFFEGEKEDFKLWELYESLEEKKEQFLSLLFRKSNLMRLQDFITAINGKEINYKKMGNRYRSDNIYKSVLQCSYSLHSIKEKIYDEYESGNSWYLYKSWHFIPIVVTNAKLKICKFDDISLSLESGKKEELTLMPM